VNIPSTRKAFQRSGRHLRRARWLYVLLFVRPALAACTSDGERDQIMDFCAEQALARGLYAPTTSMSQRRQSFTNILYLRDGGKRGRRSTWHHWVMKEGWRPYDGRSVKFAAQQKAG
jgi:hypothetical protein